MFDYDVYLFDCDGVLWLCALPARSAVDVLTTLLSQNKKVILVTNNSTKTRALLNQHVQTALGMSMPDDNCLYSSGIACAMYMKEQLKEGEKVFLIGSKGFSQVLTECGVEFIGHGPHDPMDFYEFNDFKLDPSVKFVVGGFDPHFNHTKMTKAFIYVREGGAEYVATNLDIVYPLSPTRQLPGTGSVLAGLNNALGTTPKVIGKPSPVFFDIISRDHDIPDKSRVLMVGDNLLTDIQLAVNSGIDSALVLTGVSKKDDLSECCKKPTFVIDSITYLIY
eukprot:sb/3479413/